MFIPTINTGGREAPFSTPLGLEAKSLKNGMTHYWISRAHENKQTRDGRVVTDFLFCSLGGKLFVCLSWALEIQ